MRERWLSGRAVTLHVALLVWVPGCIAAAWWQISRARDGNELSYLYMVMWPVFGLLGLVFWWMLIHTDYETVGLRGMRRQQAQGDTPSSLATAPGAASPAPLATVTEAPVVAADDDPDLAAYNARLAQLATKGPKTWRRTDPVVVRRPQ